MTRVIRCSRAAHSHGVQTIGLIAGVVLPHQKSMHAIENALDATAAEMPGAQLSQATPSKPKPIRIDGQSTAALAQALAKLSALQYEDISQKIRGILKPTTPAVQPVQHVQPSVAPGPAPKNAAPAPVFPSVAEMRKIFDRCPTVSSLLPRASAPCRNIAPSAAAGATVRLPPTDQTPLRPVGELKELFGNGYIPTPPPQQASNFTSDESAFLERQPGSPNADLTGRTDEQLSAQLCVATPRVRRVAGFSGKARVVSPNVQGPEAAAVAVSDDSSQSTDL